MQVKLETAGEIGQWIWAVRKSQGMRQDDLAALVGASHVFLGDVERGKESVQWGRLFSVLRELGIEVRVDLPLDRTPDAGSP